MKADIQRDPSFDQKRFKESFELRVEWFHDISQFSA